MLIQIILLHGFVVCISIVRMNSGGSKHSIGGEGGGGGHEMRLNAKGTQKNLHLLFVS